MFILNIAMFCPTSLDLKPSSNVSGQRGELSNFLEDFSFLGTSRERGEHPQGRRRRQALPRGAGEVPDHGRVQKEAKRFSQVKRNIPFRGIRTSIKKVFTIILNQIKSN